MAKVYDAVATTGEYTVGGETKKRYVNIGSVFEKDGKLSLKIDSIPTGNEWNGWVSFFEPKPRQQAAPAQNSEPLDDALPF